MLEKTFVHVPGVGPTTERSLWRQGCGCWSDFLTNPRSYKCGSAGREPIAETVEKSVIALEQRNHQFFNRRLKQRDVWRALHDFRDSCVYLDIETNGGSSGDDVTIIGLYDGVTYTGLVQGESLESFRDIISHYSMIVTFFGGGFDIPVLQKCFRDLPFDQIHVDLCPALRTVGVRGGLKRIERELGVTRPEAVDGLTGYDAVKLWRRYRQLRDENALETLIAYNREDVLNLPVLADHAYRLLQAQLMEEQADDDVSPAPPPAAPQDPQPVQMTLLCP